MKTFKVVFMRAIQVDGQYRLRFAYTSWCSHNTSFSELSNRLIFRVMHENGHRMPTCSRQIEASPTEMLRLSKPNQRGGKDLSLCFIDDDLHGHLLYFGQQTGGARSLSTIMQFGKSVLYRLAAHQAGLPCSSISLMSLVKVEGIRDNSLVP